MLPTSSTAIRPDGAPISRAPILALLLSTSALLLHLRPASCLLATTTTPGRHRSAALFPPAFLSPPRRRSPSRKGSTTVSSSASSSSSSSSLSSTSTTDVVVDGDLAAARDRLVAASLALSSRSVAGKVFVTSPADVMRFRDEFNRFESLAAAAASFSSPTPAPSSDERMMIGDWTLIATANLPPRVGKRKGGCDDTKTTPTTKKEGGGETKLDPLREAIKRSIGVIQRIRSVGDSSSGTIDRVDNVIEFSPLETLDGILPGKLPLFGSLSSLAPTLDKMLDFANPLKLKKAKVVLVHKAEVESTRPVLRTRIAWTSSVLNVAGTSQYLDPDGGDVFGLNNVLGEFLNAGYFDTPYVDGDVRLSRTSGPVSEQLRVFVRVGSALLAPSSNGDAGGTAAIDGVREAGAGDADVAAAATDEVASVDAGDGSVVEGVVSEDADDGSNGVVDVVSEDFDDESVDDGVVAAVKIDEIDGAEADEEDNAPEVISESPPADVETVSTTGVDEVDDQEE